MEHCEFSMGAYFQNMGKIGSTYVTADETNAAQLRQTEAEIQEKIQAGLDYGKTD